MTKILNLFSAKGIHFIVCSFFLFPLNGYSANEHIVGFNMRSCANEICSTLIVHGIAEKGPLAPLYAFSKATFISKNLKKKKQDTFHASEGYYDSVNSEIILRGVDEIAQGDMIIDLKSGEIKKFVVTSN